MPLARNSAAFSGCVPTIPGKSLSITAKVALASPAMMAPAVATAAIKVPVLAQARPATAPITRNTAIRYRFPVTELTASPAEGNTTLLAKISAAIGSQAITAALAARPFARALPAWGTEFTGQASIHSAKQEIGAQPQPGAPGLL